jgi:site-specific DNA-methyltransferase (adenine-specific)
MIELQMFNKPLPPHYCKTLVSGSALVNADCFDVFPFIEDKSIDAIICDLPYGTTACKWDSILPLDKLWKEYERIIKPNGVIVLFGAEPFSSLLRGSNLKMYKYDWYWNKSRPIGFLNVKKMPLKNTECISIFYKKQPTYNPQGVIEINKLKKNDNCKNGNNGTGLSGHNGGKMKGNYIQKYTNYPVQTLKFNSERGLHETQKPLELMEYLIKTYTNENDMVLDNTMGSGTTCLASKELNRKFIGIEKEANYYEIACRRCGF